MFAATSLAALFAVFLIQSAQLPLGDELGPGPGFFPFAISLLGLVLSAVLFFSIWRRKPQKQEPSPGFSGIRTVSAVLALVALSTIVLEPLGYTLTMLALVPAVLLTLGARSKIAIAVVSVVMSFGIFHVFYHWLNVALPVGILGM
jgi:putative tricarboxylic transport membrane protein